MGDGKTRRNRGVRDLIDAVEGHLRNEDWDNEMREALGEIQEAKNQIIQEEGEP